MTSTMFSEVKYTIVVRRNSSLYMQSMLFPSILLTTVALLGFYLPPDSGERIGLQITILLTFMVFLLAVGEMFPASTGPYLGVYFVLCMMLLGVNLAMTVLVLHLHFTPVEVEDTETQRKVERNSLSTQTKKKKAKPKKLRTTTVPRTLRRFLLFFDRCCSLKENNARWLYLSDRDDENESDSNQQSKSDDNCSNSDNDDDNLSCSSQSSVSKQKKGFVKQARNNTEYCGKEGVTSPNKLKRCYSADHTLLNSSNHSSSTNLGFSKPDIGSHGVFEQKVKKIHPLFPNYIHAYNNCDAVHNFVKAEIKPVARNNNNNIWIKPVEQRFPISNLSDNHMQMEDAKCSAEANFLPSKTKHFSQPVSPTDNREDEISFRYQIWEILHELTGFVKKNKKRRHRQKSLKQKQTEEKIRKKEKELEKEEMEQEDWKSVARAVDVLCFRLYVLLIIVSHVGLFAAALKTYLTK